MKTYEMVSGVLLLFSVLLAADSFASDVGPVLQEGTRQTYLSLQDCRRMVLQNAAYVKNSRLDILAARAQKQEAFAEWFPTVSLDGFGFRSLDPMIEIGVRDILGDNDFSRNVQMEMEQAAAVYGFSPVFSALKHGFAASLSFSQPIYAGGRIVNGNRMASLGVHAAELKSNVVLRDVVHEMESAYWQVVILEEKAVTLNLMRAFIDTLYNNVASATDAGLAVDTDLMQVELKRNELQSAQIQLKGGIRLAKMNLFDRIGQDYSLVAAVSDSIAPFIDDIVLNDRVEDLHPPKEYYIPEEEMAAESDETQLLDISLESKRLEKKMYLGEALPSVGVGVSYGYSHLMNSRTNGVIYAMLRIPISDWGRISRRIQRQEYDIEKAENDKGYLSSRLLLQIRSLWLELTTAWDRLVLAQEGMALAQKTVDRLADYYNAGLVPVSDLLQAQTMLREASEIYADRKMDYSIALTAYLSRQ